MLTRLATTVRMISVRRVVGTTARCRLGCVVGAWDTLFLWGFLTSLDAVDGRAAGLHARSDAM
jgi:hypothetical protein